MSAVGIALLIAGTFVAAAAASAFVALALCRSDKGNDAEWRLAAVRITAKRACAAAERLNTLGPYVAPALFAEAAADWDRERADFGQALQEATGLSAKQLAEVLVP